MMIAVGSPYDSDVLNVIQNIIDEVSSNLNLPKDPDTLTKRRKTTYEYALELFSTRGKVGVNYSQLKKLVVENSEATDQEKATTKLISRLRAKFEDEGFILVFYRPQEDKQPYYFIMRRPS